MVFIVDNREQLPTISQVLSMVSELTGKMSVRHRMPYDEPVDDGDAFLLNRTASGLFTLKPNITKQPCLYFGDNDYHKILQPEWNKFRLEDEMISEYIAQKQAAGDKRAMREIAVEYNDTVIYPDKVRLNCYYYRHYSFFKDIQMIFCTVLGRKMKYAGEVI